MFRSVVIQKRASARQSARPMRQSGRVKPKSRAKREQSSRELVGRCAGKRIVGAGDTVNHGIFFHQAGCSASAKIASA
jgi:hypothetical protein